MFEKRLRQITSACLVILLALCLRLGYIALFKGNAYETMAQNQQKKEIHISSVRGIVADRNKEKLTERESKKLFLKKNGNLAKDKTEETVFEFEIPERLSKVARHVVGYTSESGGVCGIEKAFDEHLSDKGEITLGFVADAHGKPVDSFEIINDSKDDKTSVILTIDSEIQKICEDVMQKHIKKGACVVLDVKSFDVLAMVSTPLITADDIKLPEEGFDGVFLNRALLSYNAGSVFKTVTLLCALEKNEEIIHSEFDCSGNFKLSKKHIFSCHKNGGHGNLSLTDSFGLSCNCTFYTLGLTCGGDAICKTASRFGFGSRLLNVSLGEEKGNIPEQKVYGAAQTLNLAIGQGEILITPLQCAAMVATLANDGIKKDVNIVSALVTADGKEKSIRNSNAQRVAGKEHAHFIREAMRECVLSGTAKLLAESPAEIAGKTGSAQSGWQSGASTLTHGWFCGFFPFESPRYAVAVLCEGGVSGADTCVEPFGEIAEKICEIYPAEQ